MANSSSVSSTSVAYSLPTRQRAERAAKCSPFRLELFQALRSHSVALQELTDDDGIHNRYTRIPLGELTAENALMWLLAVGLLRREVDGQGLTDSFRLTPLGQLLLDDWMAKGIARLEPSFQDHCYNFASRWLRRPGWLTS